MIMERKYYNSYNGLIVFERPLRLPDYTTYGILFNKDEEDHHKTNNLRCINDYVDYLFCIDRWLENGGSISEDSKVWHFPDKIHSVKCNFEFLNLLSVLVKGIFGIKKYDFDHPIKWKEGEVENEGSRLIVDKALIERYIDNTK